MASLGPGEYAHRPPSLNKQPIYINSHEGCTISGVEALPAAEARRSGSYRAETDTEKLLRLSGDERMGQRAKEGEEDHRVHGLD